MCVSSLRWRSRPPHPVVTTLLGITVSPPSLCSGTLAVTTRPPCQATAGSFCNDVSLWCHCRLISVCVCVCVCVAALMVCSGCCVTVFTVRNSGTQTGDKMFVLSDSLQTFTSSVRFSSAYYRVTERRRRRLTGFYYLKPQLKGRESKMREASTALLV